MIYGIDPGKAPSICQIDINGLPAENVIIKNKDSFPHNEFKEFIFDRIDNYDTVIIELPHSVYGSSAKSNFVFGYSVGATIQAVECVGANYTLVRPKEWQKLIWEPQDKVKGDTKATSLNAAKRILGKEYNDNLFITPRGRVVNHNLIDSFCLATYGRMINNNSYE